MQSIHNRYFIRKTSHNPAEWRICFRSGESGEELKSLVGLRFTKDTGAQNECDLQNLAYDARFYFKDLPEFTVAVGDPSEYWEKSTRAKGRALLVCSKIKVGGQTRTPPLFACGFGETAFVRAVEFAEMVRKSRTFGFIDPPPISDPPLDRYEVNMYSNIASCEGQINDAIGLLMDAKAENQIARQKAGYDENGDALELFEKPIADVIKTLNKIVDGDDRIEFDKGFEAFVESQGYARITSRMFTDDRVGTEIENSFIDGFEDYCNEGDDPDDKITEWEQRFVDEMRPQFPDDDRDDTFRRRMPDDDRDDDDDRRAESNYIDEILDEIAHIEPTGDDAESSDGTTIDDVAEFKRRGAACYHCGSQSSQYHEVGCPMSDNENFVSMDESERQTES